MSTTAPPALLVPSLLAEFFVLLWVFSFLLSAHSGYLEEARYQEVGWTITLSSVRQRQGWREYLQCTYSFNVYLPSTLCRRSSVSWPNSVRWLRYSVRTSSNIGCVLYISLPVDSFGEPGSQHMILQISSRSTACRHLRSPGRFIFAKNCLGDHLCCDNLKDGALVNYIGCRAMSRGQKMLRYRHRDEMEML